MGNYTSLSIPDALVDIKMPIWAMMEPSSFADLRGDNIDLFLSPNSHIWQLMDFHDFASQPYICEYEL
jgi:hypothetical protein